MNNENDKLQYSLLKFLWLSTPLSKKRDDAIPSFLSQVESLKNFSLIERHLLANHLHLRTFKNHERIFKQGDRGLGIYYILSGCVSIWASEFDVDQEVLSLENSNKKSSDPLIVLKQFDQFGEISLVQENVSRTASALAQGPTQLLALFRPDLEDLMANAPTVANKILISISQIMAYRMTKMSEEIRRLKILLNHGNEYAGI